MALSRLNYNSLNVTPTASKGIGFDSGADDLSTDFAGGAITFIKKLTSDGSDDDLSFVDGTSDVVLDNTYKEYMFIFNDIHPETDNKIFQFNMSVDSGSNYNVTKTSTGFFAYTYEGSENESALTYELGLAQSTAFQSLSSGVGNDNDQSVSGYLHIFNPSSTTFVKHFILKSCLSSHDNAAIEWSAAGYGNTTSAVDAVQFKFASGEIQAGTISLYGIK